MSIVTDSMRTLASRSARQKRRNASAPRPRATHTMRPVSKSMTRVQGFFWIIRRTEVE